MLSMSKVTDLRAAGCWGLRSVHQNRIGLIDRVLEPDLRVRQLMGDAVSYIGTELTDYVLY